MSAIRGLKIVENFISEPQEEALLQIIDKQIGDKSLKRRVNIMAINTIIEIDFSATRSLFQTGWISTAISFFLKILLVKNPIK